MNLPNGLAAFIAAVFLGSTAAYSETYKESFECTFGRGLANRPTPTRVVFSLDEFGRSALLHEVEIPKIDTVVGSGRVDRDSIRRLNIAWSGREYVYSDSGRTVASNEAYSLAVDMLDTEFSIFLDRRSMKATARSKNSQGRSRDGNATGKCVAIPTPK